LFVVANNPTDGLGVFVSDDGLSFRSIVSGGFGDHETTSAVPYVVDGRLVLGVTNQRTGSQLWRQGDDPDAPFVKVLGVLAEDIDGFAPGSVVFDGATYIGSVDRDGAVLLRTEDGMAFEAVDGIGVPRSAGALRPQLVFRGALYVVAADPEGLDVVRTTDGDRFEPVVSGGFDAGQDRNVDGALVAVDERLLLVASAIDPRREPGVAPIEVAPEHGFQLWRSADGTSWDRVDGPGLGDPHSVAAAPIVAGGMAFLAVSNYEEGDAILRSADGLDWEPIFRQSSTAHSSMGFSPFVIDRHLVIFHGDVVSGLSAWRLRAPVEAEAGVPIWVWVVGAGLLTVIGLGSALLFRRRISEPMAGDRIIAPRDRTRVKTGT